MAIEANNIGDYLSAVQYFILMPASNLTLCIAALLIFVLQSLQVTAQVPTTLSYQGLLTDASGSPVPDGKHNITFKFYDASSVLKETRIIKGVDTFKGLFTQLIGDNHGDAGSSNAPLPYTIGNEQYSVGIEVDGGTELSPRAKLTTVPYAFKAQSANTMDAAGLTGTANLPNTVLDTDLQDLADGSLTGSKVGTGINASNLTTGTLPASVIPSSSTVPVGTVIAFAGVTIPTGWLLCDGAPVSRSTYSTLYNVILISWGSGNETTTFNVPDLRGKFLRGNDDRATPVAQGDPAAPRVVGSYQVDAFQGHRHDKPPTAGNFVGENGTGISLSSGSGYGRHYSTGDAIADGSNITPRVTSETRPINYSVNYIIKY